jgi:diguanylate cyclase (GGDEF)-like protein
VALFLRSLWEGLLPSELRQDPELLRRANRVAALHLAMLIWVPVFGVLYYLLGAHIGANVIFSGGVLLIGSLTLLRRGKSPALCGGLLTAAAWYVYTALACLTGGATAPVMVWYASIPILAVLMCGTRAGFYWTLYSAATIAGFALWQELGYQCLNEVSPAGLRFLGFTGLVGLLACVYILVNLLKNIELNVQESLHEANRCLELQATLDGLTGIGNRRSFDMVLDEEWRRHERGQLPLSVLLIDVDLFKQYNDELGHLAGDDCLRSIARAIQTSVGRAGDFVARYGGEEFAVILPDTDLNASIWIAEEIRRGVERAQIHHPNSTVGMHVTISVGITTCVPLRNAWCLDFLHNADVALYRAKANGRNQSVHIGSTTPVRPAMQQAATVGS